MLEYADDVDRGVILIPSMEWLPCGYPTAKTRDFVSNSTHCCAVGRFRAVPGANSWPSVVYAAFGKLSTPLISPIVSRYFSACVPVVTASAASTYSVSTFISSSTTPTVGLVTREQYGGHLWLSRTALGRTSRPASDRT